MEFIVGNFVPLLFIGLLVFLLTGFPVAFSLAATGLFFGFLGMAVVLTLFYFSDAASLGPWAAAVCLLMLSVFVNGSHGMVGGAATMDFGGRKAAAGVNDLPGDMLREFIDTFAAFYARG